MTYINMDRLCMLAICAEKGEVAAMKRLLTNCLLFLASGLAGVAAERPVAAEMVDVPAERRDYGMPIGNVRVTFADGHTEMWTRLGRCMELRRSASGLVGWSRYTTRNAHGEPVNNVLRVMVTNSRWQDFQTELPFIRDWDFAEEDESVVVVSGGRHGAGIMQCFSLKTGKLTGTVNEATKKEKMPEWARKFLEKREWEREAEAVKSGER